MFNIVLYQPEIPQNTGSIIRICVNTGCKLHIIEPFSFTLDEKKLKRAGLDYINKALITLHNDFESFINSTNPKNIYLCSTKADKYYSDVKFTQNDFLVFGPESRGLPQELMQSYTSNNKIKIPMHPDGRSLNLATAVSIITYEAWRQNNFAIKP